MLPIKKYSYLNFKIKYQITITYISSNYKKLYTVIYNSNFLTTMISIIVFKH